MSENHTNSFFQDCWPWGCCWYAWTQQWWRHSETYWWMRTHSTTIQVWHASCRNTKSCLLIIGDTARPAEFFQVVIASSTIVSLRLGMKTIWKAQWSTATQPCARCNKWNKIQTLSLSLDGADSNLSSSAANTTTSPWLVTPQAFVRFMKCHWSVTSLVWDWVVANLAPIAHQRRPYQIPLSECQPGSQKSTFNTMFSAQWLNEGKQL